MTSFFLTIVISALAGGACGYLLARYIWQDRLLLLEEERQELRRQRLELHRENFQKSTSQIHRPAAIETNSPDHSSEELEQLRLEMTLLREDHRIERELLQNEINDLKPDKYLHSDLAESDAVIIELDSPVDAEEATMEVAVMEETIMEETVILDSSEEEVFSSEAVEEANEKEQVEPKTKERPALIAPVPTDIESLFRVPRVEEPAVKPENSRETESGQEAAAPKEEMEREKEVSEQDLETSIYDSPVTSDITSYDIAETGAQESSEDPGRAVEEAPAGSADTLSEDSAQQTEAAPVAPADELTQEAEAAPFAIHWNADRPGRHEGFPPSNESAEPTIRDVDSPEEAVSSEPAIPVFRSLHDMLTASGVSPASLESAEAASTPESPTWSPRSASSQPPLSITSSDEALIQSIVSLDAESFSLLDELGYASLTRLAQLSPSEIRRLAQVFRINPDQIEQYWMPTAMAHLNMQSPRRS